MLTVAFLVVAAVISLSDLHALAGLLLVAVVMMITFVFPFIREARCNHETSTSLQALPLLIDHFITTR